jgi:hypothetical protein
LSQHCHQQGCAGASPAGSCGAGAVRPGRQRLSPPLPGAATPQRAACIEPHANGSLRSGSPRCEPQPVAPSQHLQRTTAHRGTCCHHRPAGCAAGRSWSWVLAGHGLRALRLLAWACAEGRTPGQLCGGSRGRPGGRGGVFEAFRRTGTLGRENPAAPGVGESAASEAESSVLIYAYPSS